MAEPCRCEAPNRECLRMGLPMVGQRWKLCRGVGVLPEKSEAARAKWDRLAQQRTSGAQSLPQAPPLLVRLAHFVVALVGHVTDGLRRRSKAEMARILDTHCQPCEWFRGGHCTHRKCGCAVNREKRFFNKLAWRSEHCPVGKW